MTIIVVIALIVVVVSMFGFLYRAVKGPSVADRVVALDALGISLMAVIALFSILLNTTHYISIMMLLAILSFLGTVSFAKFMDKGEIIEYDRHHRQ
ncbi:Na(+)/H(+) antiporter subunit F1 [Macrococcus equipercicus]|uniref:Na(+)/H(+) antiporter subunit F1 n=1 Tax=Macrococcus equipercicus TaxID=69967 RepID=A0A9Q9F1T3_9STAP|nr:Na(+)/H(+) antiporter subunit F1 [Macrococcus equipercicus]KAA1042552.1 Na(+)/H(+) antiporter subunit F1 [Macrococcus equipercicus]UTH14413.1 Na(+)/H(+) antiporter subunit F1 [Macrococcus equipercicus]